MKVIRRAIFIIILALSVGALVQNMPTLSSAVPFQFFSTNPIQLPLIMWLLLAFGLGFLICYFFDLRKTFQHRKQRKSLEKENKNLKAELDQHRNKFLTESAPKNNEAPHESMCGSIASTYMNPLRTHATNHSRIHARIHCKSIHESMYEPKCDSM